MHTCEDAIIVMFILSNYMILLQIYHKPEFGFLIRFLAWIKLPQIKI